jgi:hypothetical protein
MGWRRAKIVSTVTSGSASDGSLEDEHTREAKVLIERWRRHYNTVRPQSSLGYRPPAPETITSDEAGAAETREAPPTRPRITQELGVEQKAISASLRGLLVL